MSIRVSPLALPPGLCIRVTLLALPLCLASSAPAALPPDAAAAPALIGGAAPCPIGNQDCDGDGVANVDDNCARVANAGQTDADGDGMGNRCDPDFNDDGVVNFADLGFLRERFFTSDAIADLNVDGSVDMKDLAILRTFFFRPAGPPGRMSFVNPQGGAWDDSRNWSPRSLPAAGVVATVEEVSGVTIEIGPGVVAEAFTTIRTDGNTLRLAGGSLRRVVDADFFGPTVGNRIVVTSDSRFEDLTAAIDIEVSDGSLVTVTGGLAVFGDLVIRGTSLPTGLLFVGEQIFQASDTIRFASDGNPDAGDPQLRSVDGRLFIRPAAERLTITGDRGTIGTPGFPVWIAGDIVASGGDSHLAVTGSSVDFYGVGVALRGATLRMTNLSPTDAAFRIDSGGEVLMDGDFSMVDRGALEFFAGGADPAAYGRIHVTGSLDLADGALQLALIDYAPAAGDSLQLITYGSLAAPAGTLFLQDPGAGLAWSLDYGPAALSLDVVAE